MSAKLLASGQASLGELHRGEPAWQRIRYGAGWKALCVHQVPEEGRSQYLQAAGLLDQGVPPAADAANEHGGRDGHAALPRGAKRSTCAQTAVLLGGDRHFSRFARARPECVNASARCCKCVCLTSPASALMAASWCASGMTTA